jgi:membrane-bound lytic murein transglycosylase D
MLKTRIVKAGFFGHGALFLIVSPVAVNSQAENLLNDKQPSNTIILEQASTPKATALYNDSTGSTPKVETVLPTITLNAAAVQYAQKYIKKNKEDLALIEKNSDRYFRIIESALKRYDVPVELKYLAVVESELKSNALSPVGARGPWQLMPATARDLGLKITHKTDERTHYYKSSNAAAKYLRDLYSEFGDWLLVIAAYNSGSGVVYKAIKKSGSRNFWKLQRFLPLETSLHVKRFISTHLFFQEENSLTMLTKAETNAYFKAVAKAKVSYGLSHSHDSIIAVR